MRNLDNLYQTIGGSETIEKAIVAFYRRVLDDKELRPFFRSTDMAHLRGGQSMFVSMMLGGIDDFSGKDLGAAHKQARAEGLNAGHMGAFLKHFRDALDEVGVAPEHAEKMVELLDAQRATVLDHGRP